MKELLESAKDFKIIPNNFKSSGAFEVQSITDDVIKVKLNLLDKSEIVDYQLNSNVEVFGVNNIGLIYFETKILDKNEDDLTLALSGDFSIIQRREYSRVGMTKGKVIFKDKAPDFVQKIEDISAGGIKFISNEPLETDKHYEIEIKLSNNMNIECTLQPIRIIEAEEDGNTVCTISGKFTDLENADRIVLVQYAFKIKMEEQNKEND